MKHFFTVILLLILHFITLPVFTSSVVQLPELLKPEKIVIQQGYLYAADGFSVKIFNLSDGKLINALGKKGEGPVEFKLPPFIALGNNLLLANSSGKVSLFTLKGKLIKEIKVKGMLPKYKPVLEGFVAEARQLPKDGKMQRAVGLYNDNFELIKKLYKLPPLSGEVITPKNKGTYEIIADYLDYKTTGNKIFIADTNHGFLIKVFDNKGNFLYDIKQKYVKREIEENIKKKYLKSLKQMQGYKIYEELYTFTFPRYYPAFKNFMVDSNKIYIESFITKDNKMEFLTFDLKGNKLQSNFLPVPRILRNQNPLYYFYKGQYFYLKENTGTDMWELHKIDLEAKINKRTNSKTKLPSPRALASPLP